MSPTGVLSHSISLSIDPGGVTIRRAMKFTTAAPGAAGDNGAIAWTMVQVGPVSDTYKLAYQMNVALAIQQQKSRFQMGFTYHADLKGRQMQLLDLILPHTAIIDGPRGGDTPNIEQQHEPVWVKPRQIEDGKLIEKEDVVKALTEYQSPYVQSMATAIIRAQDTIRIAALTGSRIIGLDGTTTQAFTPNAALVGAGTVAGTIGSSDGATDTGMNIRKLQRVKTLWRQQFIEVDSEECWVCLNAVGMGQLFNDIITINTDTAKMAVIDRDKRVVQQVAGFNVVSHESLPDIDATHFSAWAWLKSGMHEGEFSPLETNVAPNPAKKFRPQTYAEIWFGATRSEDGRVIKISNFKNMTGPNA